MQTHISKRTDASQPFDHKELLAILALEAKRPVIETKRNIKLVDYSLAENWLRSLNVAENLFDFNKDITQLIETGNRVKETVGPLTIEKIESGDADFKALIEKITKHLYKSDKLAKSDFIFVFGGSNTGRIYKAIELWQAEWAPNIWISGAHPIYRTTEPEAITFKNIAIRSGIPESNIFIEPNSITIADNCRRSLNLMDELNISFERMILVIDWYAQLRAWMTLEKYISATSTLYRTSAFMPPNSKVAPTNWFKTNYGVNIVFNEYLKMMFTDALVMNKIV